MPSTQKTTTTGPAEKHLVSAETQTSPLPPAPSAASTSLTVSTATTSVQESSIEERWRQVINYRAEAERLLKLAAELEQQLNLAETQRRQQQSTARPLSLIAEEGARVSPRNGSINAFPEEEEEEENFGAGQSGAPHQATDDEEEEEQENVANAPPASSR